MSALDKDTEEFRFVRDGVYTFVYMIAQAIQTYRLSAAGTVGGSLSDVLSAFRAEHGDIVRVLGRLSRSGVEGLSGKLIDQADFVWDCLQP